MKGKSNKGDYFLDVLAASVGGYVAGCAKMEDTELVSIMIPVRAKEDIGFVYLMLNERNGLIKIGWSLNPSFRERTLQSEEPQVKLIKKFPALKFDEKFLHDKYSDMRIRGEWFRLSNQDLNEIYTYFA